MQHFHLGTRECKVQIAELDITGDRTIRRLYIRLIVHVDVGVQQITDTAQAGFAAGVHLDQHGDGHDGPDAGGEITDEFDQAAGVENTLVYQISTVSQDDTDDGFHEQGDHDVHQGGHADEGYVDFLVVLVQLTEGQKLLHFLREGLDDGDAGEGLLREIGKGRKGFLAVAPFLAHPLAQDHGAEHQRTHGDQGEQGQGPAHAEHFHECHDT